MANIRTFVNEADGQTYNCATFYSELDGFRITPFDPLNGIVADHYGDYPQYWRKIWTGTTDGEPRPRYIYKAADETLTTTGAYSFKINQSTIPTIQQEIIPSSQWISGPWQNTGLMFAHSSIWVGISAHIKNEYGRWTYIECRIRFVYSENEPTDPPISDSSPTINLVSRGFSTDGSSATVIGLLWTMWEWLQDYILNADWYFYAGSFPYQVGSTSYPYIGFIPIYQNEILSWTSYGSPNSPTSYFWNNVAQDSGEDADDYRPGHEPVPHTDDLERAVVSVKTAKTALKKYDASLAAVARTGSYNDLTNKPSSYSLPTMSSSTKGGAKLGTGLVVSNNALSIDETWLDAKIDEALGVILNASY